MRLCVRGAVQGVGFRPFVYREAQALGLAGFVVNTPGGVSIEVEGAPEAIRSLVARIEREPPPNTRITDLAREALAPLGDTIFEIRESVLAGRSYRTLRPAKTVAPRFSTPATAAIAIPSPIARIAGRAIRLSPTSPTIARAPVCAAS
jgi:hydrogenase maturation protein HypF